VIRGMVAILRAPRTEARLVQEAPRATQLLVPSCRLVQERPWRTGRGPSALAGGVQAEPIFRLPCDRKGTMAR
jgi:hypothetical protein